MKNSITYNFQGWIENNFGIVYIGNLSNYENFSDKPKYMLLPAASCTEIDNCTISITIKDFNSLKRKKQIIYKNHLSN